MIVVTIEEILTTVYCDSWKYYCNSCDTVEYIEFSAPCMGCSGSMACILKHGGAYSCW